MDFDIDKFKQNAALIFAALEFRNLNVLPSNLAEEFLVLTTDISAGKPGRYSFDQTPYLREPLDCLSATSPVRVLGVKKAAQIGFTQGFIIPGICYIIGYDPGNVLFLSANEVLSKEMVTTRLDSGIRSYKMEHLIRPNVRKKRNQRTGDTDSHKEFAGGNLFAGSVQAVDKLGKQRSIKYLFADDWEAAPVADKEQGNIFHILQQRFSAAASTMKQAYISTPQCEPSNIDQVYQLGDQRKWTIPCPCCGVYTEVNWKMTGKDGQPAGITWKLDENGELIDSSVGFTCPDCGETWREKHKYESNLKGVWVPTAKPKRPNYRSYHINALCAAPFMYGWTHYVRMYIDIFKSGACDKDKMKTFDNLVLGDVYVERPDEIEFNDMQNSRGDYCACAIPDLYSESVGAGKIILTTIGIDCGGYENDARLDYTVIAYSENGQKFVIDEGEIGTHKAGNKANNEDETRTKWTYRQGVDNCVWDEVERMMHTGYKSQFDGRDIPIDIAAIDGGYLREHVQFFVDSRRVTSVMVHGDGHEKLHKPNAGAMERVMYKRSQSDSGSLLIESNYIKAKIYADLEIRWNGEGLQPSNFVNFPYADGVKFTKDGFFKQLAGEERVAKYGAYGKLAGWVYVKKMGFQNHKLDSTCYAEIAKYVFVDETMGKMKSKWVDFVEYMLA